MVAKVHFVRWNAKVIGNTSSLSAKIIYRTYLGASNIVNYVGGTLDCKRFVSVAKPFEPVVKWLKHCFYYQL